MRRFWWDLGLAVVLLSLTVGYGFGQAVIGNPAPARAPAAAAFSVHESIAVPGSGAVVSSTHAPSELPSSPESAGISVSFAVPVNPSVESPSQAAYSIEFSEQGLPPGLTWQVTVNGEAKHIITDGGMDTLVWTHLPSGTYSYSVEGNPGWHQTTLTYSGEVTVSGRSVTEPTLLYSPVTYTATFSEFGLPSGLDWRVRLGFARESLTTDGGTDSLSWAGLANGTYGYHVSYLRGWTQTTLPYRGLLIVNGAPVDEPTIDYSPVTFLVTFVQSGLPGGTSWSVTLNGDTQSSVEPTIAFAEPNGVYSYSIGGAPGYHPSPSLGSVTVDWQNVRVPVTFKQVTYSVVFTETGLPGGTSWSVTLNGDTQSSTGASIAFTEPNATYSYTLGGVPGYSASSYSGLLTVNGADVVEPVYFAQVTYPVTFTEYGLPGSTSWSVTLNGDTQSSTGAPIEFNEPNGTYSYSATSTDKSYSTSAGTVSVVGEAASVDVPFALVTYSITFTESGLPGGTSWSVTLDGDLQSSTGPVIAFSEPNGTYGYSIGGMPGYSASSYSGTAIVSGTDLAVSVSFTKVTYTVAFVETGLPSGTLWAVTLNGEAHSSVAALIVFTESNGSYPYSIGPVTGFSTASYSGSVAVNGGDVAVPVPFTQVTYAVTFTESGLPGGTSWAVTLNSSSQSTTRRSITFDEANGTYPYSLGAVPGYNASSWFGSVVVSGAPVLVEIEFTQVTYSVAFSESGLPGGTVWSVTLNGATLSSTGSSIEFDEPNGTYAFAVGGEPGYSAGSYSGAVTVNGADVAVTVSFTQVTYSVTFTETGLPGGTPWSVSLGESVQTSTGSQISFIVPNGTYVYGLGGVPGYSAGSYFGAVMVNGADLAVPVSFTQVTYSVTFTETGLPGGTSWSVTLDGATQSSTGTTVVFTEPNGTYSFGLGSVPGYSASLTFGTVTVMGESITESIVFSLVPPPTYEVTFVETSLPSGTSWSVTLNGDTLSSTGTSISFLETNGAYPYYFTTANKSYSASAGTVTVAGAPESVGVAFGLVTYTVTFTQSGLPGGTSWTVTLDGTTHGSSGSTIQFTEPNGTYIFAIAVVSNYSPTPSSGSVVVNGGDLSVSVSFVYGTYTVTFTESGLPSGRTWSVGFDGALQSTTGPSISFTVPAGSYTYLVRSGGAFRVQGFAPEGSIAVAADVSEMVKFVRGPTYALAFHERGLKAGTTWCVTIGGTICSATPRIVFKHMMAGTYTFVLETFGGVTTQVKLGSSWTTESSGAATLTSGSGRVQVQYVYAVTFTETGLTTGTSWSVSAAGQTGTSTGPTIVLYLTNGTHRFTVLAVSGYIAVPSSGSVAVAGAPESKSITFRS